MIGAARLLETDIVLGGYRIPNKVKRA